MRSRNIRGSGGRTWAKWAKNTFHGSSSELFLLLVPVPSMSKYWEQHPLFRKSKDSCGRDVWITNETYWELRENPGFSCLENPQLWWREEPTRRREMMTTVLLISPRSWRTPVTGSWERYPESTTLMVFNKWCRRSESTLFLQKVKKKFKKLIPDFCVNLFENMH